MKGVANILENDATTIALLNDGANSIFKIIAEQTAGVPHLIIEEEDINPNPTMTGASTIDDVQTRILCVSDRLYTGDGVGGASEVSDAVRSALDSVSGAYDGEEIVDIDFEGQSTFTEGELDHTRTIYEQVYTVIKRR